MELKLLPSQKIHHEVFQYATVSGMTKMSLMLCNGGFDLVKKEKRRGIINKSSIINIDPKHPYTRQINKRRKYLPSGGLDSGIGASAGG